MTRMKNVPSVSVTYAQTGGSTKSNELGMRAMQERAYEKRGEQYLLIKSPPASGKSRALMFIALDKLENQGVKQAIVAVPEKTIGASFNDEPLSKFGFWADWCIFRDIRPPIPTTSAHLYRGIRPALTRCREALVFDISFLAFRHVVEGLSFGRIVRRVRAGRRCAPAGRGWHLRRWVHQ